MCFEDSRWYFKSFAFMSLGDITLRVDLALSWWTVMQWETEVPLRGFSGGDINRGSQSRAGLTLHKQQFKNSFDVF